MNPYYEEEWGDVYHGNALDVLRQLPEASVNCCVTSPPYWGLRDYGTGQWDGGRSGCKHRVGGQVQDTKAIGAIVSGVRPGVDASRCLDCGAIRIDKQIGLEKTPDEYVDQLVSVFSEVRRVLCDDGTLWVNLGDSYAGSWGAQGRQGETGMKGRTASYERMIAAAAKKKSHAGSIPDGSGLKPKDLVGIPWRCAFALQADGWWLRSDIIWAKPAPMPESVEDRPTRSHEYIFLLTKRERYYYDFEAIKEPAVSGHPSGNGYKRGSRLSYQDGNGPRGSDEQWKPSRPSAKKGSFNGKTEAMAETGQNAFSAMTEYRNKRDVWTVDTKPFPEAHFATFPEALIRPCVLAGCPEGGIVLDPFSGAGTTALVAKKNGRRFIGVELNAEYIDISKRRLSQNMLPFEGVSEC